MKEKESLKKLHKDHRQRLKNKFEKFGIDCLADHEVLELLLFYAIPRKDVNPIAHKLLDNFGSLEEVLTASVQELKQIDGMGQSSALMLNFLGTVYKKLDLNKKSARAVISSAKMAKTFCRKLYENNFDNEKFYVICLDSKNKVILTKLIKEGTADSIDVRVDEIMNVCASVGCKRMIISHSHTGKSASFSDDDTYFTKLVASACLVSSIDLLDHIIISSDDDFSFAEFKLLDSIKFNAYEHMTFIKTQYMKKCKSSRPLTASSFHSPNYEV